MGEEVLGRIERWERRERNIIFFIIFLYNLYNFIESYKKIETKKLKC